MRMVTNTALPALETGRLSRPDGVALAWSACGPKAAPALLFAHGFGQTGAAWDGAMQALARRGWRCLAFDARGHGLSGRVPGGAYHMQQFFDDLAAMAARTPRPPVLVGASMGGLLGLALAGERRPVPFSALVLLDITPRWEPAGVERILRFMRARPQGFASLDEVAQAVAAYLPGRARRKSSASLVRLLRRGEDGRWYWHWDPAMLGPIAEEGARYQQRLEAAAAHVDIPVLLLSGSRSDVVSRQTIAEFQARVPQARHVEVAGATHMLAGDANDAFTREITRFLDPLLVPASAGKTGTR